MDEKQRSPPINPLLLRIRTSIASLRSTSYATNYNLLPFPTVSPSTTPLPPTSFFRHGRGLRLILFPPYFVRRKWGYISFILLVLFIVVVRLHFAKRNVPFEESPAITGHTKESQQQPRPLPIFSTFTDNYPKQLAILILTSSNTSLNTFSKSIIDTWGKIAKQNSVDLWFATSEDTLKKFGWPNIPHDWEGKGIEEIDDDIVEDDSNSDDKNRLRKELNDMLREIVQETMVFNEPTELSEEQKEFQRLTKALHYLYKNHADRYNYILKITDKTFVRLPNLLELLSILNNTENNFPTMKQPKLIGRPSLDPVTTKTFCFKGSGYIINKNLLTIIGPHLPFCLGTLNNNNKNDLREDLAIERCFTQYVPTFKGCETFIGVENDNKLRGHEFLYLRPDDEVNWEKYKEPLEVFNDGYMNGWRFANAIVIGEVKDPSNMIALEEWYGKGGRFDKLVEEMGGVIPDPEPLSIPTQDNNNENGNVDNVEGILTIMTAAPTDTSNENVIHKQSSAVVLPTISSGKLPKEQIKDLKNIIDTTNSIHTTIPT